MLRFLLSSLLASFVVLGLADAGPELVNSFYESVGGVVPRVRQIAWSARLGGWLLEATALTGLFLLVQARRASWWFVDGLSVALLAWVFRGPLLVLTVVARAGLAREPWWQLSLHWLVAYALCGLLIGWFGRDLAVGGAAAAVPSSAGASYAKPSSSLDSYDDE